MDQYALVAEVLWGGFGLSIIAAVAGVLLAGRGHRGGALVLLFASALGTLAFSLIGGFSVGRFTALIPVLVTGYMAGMGRGRRTLVVCLLGAAAVYLACSWLLTPLVLSGSALSLLFGFWAIPVYLIAAVAVFGWGLMHLPARA